MSRERTLLILDPSDNGVQSLINQLLTETTVSLDIICTQRYEKLNELQAYLIKIYDILRYQAELTNKTKILTRVLYNDNYKDKQEYWDAIYINNKQMENKIALRMIDELKFLEKPIIYLFSTSGSKFRVPLTCDDEAKIGCYKKTAVGGTFDHLHDGHKILLSIASFITESSMIIGITGQKLLQNKKFKEYLQTFEQRKASVSEFVHFVSPGLELKLYEINDVCGPTAYVEDIDALILSAETQSGGDYINKIRQEKGFHPLAIHTIDVVGGGSGEDHWADKLSSTKLRELEHQEHLEAMGTISK